MAELADARDLKSRGGNPPCGFESRFGHLSGTEQTVEVDTAIVRGLLLLFAGRIEVPEVIAASLHILVTGNSQAVPFDQKIL